MHQVQIKNDFIFPKDTLVRIVFNTLTNVNLVHVWIGSSVCDNESLNIENFSYLRKPFGGLCQNLNRTNFFLKQICMLSNDQKQPPAIFCKKRCSL